MGFGALATLLIQWNLTRAILFDDYLARPEIVYENNDETYYLSLISESAKGNMSLGSPFIKERSKERFLYPALNVQVVGMFERLFHLNTKTVSILFDYFAVFGVSAVVFFAFLSFFQFRSFGYLAAGFYLMFPRMFNMWRRPVSPQINFIPLAVFLAFYFSRLTFWKRELGLAFAAGIMFYTYPYHWSFALALLFISDVFSCVREKRAVLRLLWKYLVILGMSAWYLTNLFSVYRLPYYKETMERIGALASRMPAGYFTQALIVLLLALFFIARKYLAKKDLAIPYGNIKKAIFGLLAALVVLNQQFVTGMQLEFNTHYLPLIIFFVVALISAGVFVFCERHERHKKIFFAAGTAVLLAMTSLNVYTRIHDNPFLRETAPWRTAASGVYEWFLQQNIQNTVVYPPHELAEDIPIYTKNYVSFSGLQRLQFIPTDELIDRFSYYDVANASINEDLLAHQRLLFGVSYIAQMQKEEVLGRIKAFFGKSPSRARQLSEYIPYDFEALRKKRARATVAEFEDYLNRYHVDYLIYRKAGKESVYNSVAGIIVFDNGQYVIKVR